MEGTAVAAPALSTAQDEEATFARVEGLNAETLREKRKHLGPRYTDNSDLSSDQLNEILSEYYSIEKLARYINQRNIAGDLKWQSVALQFPDNIICDSTIVAQILQNLLNKWNKEFHDIKHQENLLDEEDKGGKRQEKEIDFTTKIKASSMNRDIESVEKTIDKKTCGGNCGSKCKNRDKFHQDVWILADTSYSPCCIDEVAAGHVNAELVVHFGDACLNPIDKIYSCYVFGKPYLDLLKLTDTFKNVYNDKSEKIVLMGDTSYSYVLTQLYKLLRNEEYENLVIANVDYGKAGKKATVIDGCNDDIDLENSFKSVNRIFSGFNKDDFDDYIKYNVDEDDENFEEESKYDGFTQEYSLFHITRPHDARILQLTTKFKELNIIDPESIEIVNDQFPTMMRRYRNMQVARTASTVGILVNTLSLANTRILLNHVIKSIVDAGKKHYMFVVGKPNVAKLANFECVDVWCILGCGQSGIVIDMFGDYFKPIITPYELKLALMPQVTWTGKWITDFDAMIEEDDKVSEDIIQDDKEQEENDDEFAPEYDPVTGTLKLNQPLRQLKHLELELDMECNKDGRIVNENDDMSLVKKFSSTLAVGKTVSTSALGLQGREWTGLGSDFNHEEVSSEGALVEDGRTGIARGYSDV